MFRLTCSIMLWRGRSTANKYHWHVWGFSECLGHTGFVHTHSVCAFVVYTAQAPGCSARELPKEGPGLHALPRSKPLRFRFLGPPQRHKLGWTCVLCPSQVRAAQTTRCLASTLPRWAVHLISSLVLAAWFLVVRSGSIVSGVPCVSSRELISGCNPPGGCQPSRIPGRLG